MGSECTIQCYVDRNGLIPCLRATELSPNSNKDILNNTSRNCEDNFHQYKPSPLVLKICCLSLTVPVFVTLLIEPNLLSDMPHHKVDHRHLNQEITLNNVRL